MCGILGIIGTRWVDSAERALDSLNSRGPDTQSIHKDGAVALCHTRLSVIDIAGGSQPMHTHDRRYSIIFNGEIYNAKILRNQLESIGISFTSDHSDTEVLLHGYRHWGKKLINKLDGMFAFAVWDKEKQKLFIVRDKFGIKPIFYSNLDSGLIFSSTLAPFFTLEKFPRKLNPFALRDYLAFQTPLAPDTFLKDVLQLPPAHWLEYDFSKNKLEIERWWSIPEKVNPRMDQQELLIVIDEALRESVQRQMVSDVSLGAFLSGGIDSSLMIHYMSQLTSKPIDTFTLKFEDAGFDETHHAREVARHFGCNHYVVEAPSIDADYFVRSIQSLDQPLADPAYVMTYALSERTKENVTVAISGDGGDELFGGYDRFKITEDNYPEKYWHSSIRKLIDIGLLPSSLTRRVLNGQERLLYSKIETGPWRGRKDMSSLVDHRLLQTMKPENTLNLWRNLLQEFGGRMDSDTLMKADLWTYLSENCLVKTDRASMAHGLEIRVPMLGEPVINAAIQIPASIHLQAGSKTLLTLLAQKHLPETVWNRPKHGFSVPLRTLFNESWGPLVKDYISRTSKIAPFMRQSNLEDRWSRINQNGQSRRLMYAILVLLIWMDKNEIEFDS